MTDVTSKQGWHPSTNGGIRVGSLYEEPHESHSGHQSDPPRNPDQCPRCAAGGSKDSGNDIHQSEERGRPEGLQREAPMNYDAWLEAPYTEARDACESCDDRGCHLCDRQMAYDWHISTDPRI